jgi:dipeptidyl aminopeptidase/acylaminoacyl peptidase
MRAGRWDSPLAPEAIAASGLKLAQPCVAGERLFWLEGRPLERGRVALMQRDAQGERETLPGRSVRSRVYEYGGGAFAVGPTGLAFVDDADQQVWWLPDGGVPRVLDATPGLRHGDLALDLAHRRVLAIEEDGRADAHRPVHRVIALPLDGGPRQELAAGADFHAAPRVRADGTALCWLEWDAADMPWDATRLMRADLDGSGRPQLAQLVAGGADESVSQPEWGPDGALWFVSDASGRWQVERIRDGQRQRLTDGEREHGLPAWQLGQRNYGLPDAHTLVVAGTARGLWRVARLDLVSGTRVELATTLTQVDHLHAADGRVVLLAGGPRDALAVLALDHRQDRLDTLRRSTTLTLAADAISEPEAIEVASTAGSTWALYHPPRHATRALAPDERPPLVVRCHGGPTAAASSALDARVQAWTTRGFAWCEVNYRGSTGFGRAYRRALDGEWGVIDAADCIAVAHDLVQRGRADPARLAVAGSSAGGYTALRALLGTTPFTCGVLQYPVADLVSAMHDTHKFEARYGDRLLGPWPAARAVWEARSPLGRVADIRVPVLLAHGDADPVVPIAQSERLVAALHAAGVPGRLERHAGEGHGFRRADTIARVLSAELAFVACSGRES